MLVQVFHSFFDSSFVPVHEWLCKYYAVDSVYSVLLQDDQLCTVVQTESGVPKYYYIRENDLLDALQKTEDKNLASRLAWFLIRHHDVYSDSDELVHNYLKTIGVQIERVPFLCTATDLVASCSQGKFSSTAKKNVASYKVVGNKEFFSLLIPLASPDLRDLLFSRLRRIAL